VASLNTKDRPFGIAGQPVDGDLYSEEVEVKPDADPTDTITHPGPAVNLDYQAQPDPDTNILGSPGKFSAQRLGYKTK
jgi:hypothetical protein